MPEPTIRPHHPSARELSLLAAAFGLDDEELDLEQIEVTGVSSGSWRVEAGDLFVALPGRERHGADHAAEAIERGAVAIVSDADGAARIGAVDVPVLVVDEPRLALGHLAEWVYRTDRDDSRLIGVTGTRGKTSVVRLVDALLRVLGDDTAISTSHERRVGDELVPAGLTSPEADQLHAMVARMRELGVRVGSIEVTAHGIREHRIAGLELDVVGIAAFDASLHADAGSAERAFAAMLELFAPEHARRGVIALGDDWGRRVLESTRIPVATVSTDPAAGADWLASAERSRRGFVVALTGRDGRSVRTPVLVGDDERFDFARYGALDLGLALVLLEEAGWDLEQVQDALDRVGALDLDDHRGDADDDDTGASAAGREAGW